MIPHNVLAVCESNATFRLNITKYAYFSLWHTVFHLTVYRQNFDLVLVNLGERVGCLILKIKRVFQ